MGQHRPLLVYFSHFQPQFYRKLVDFSGNRTQIVRVEGENVDHLTTTTANKIKLWLTNALGIGPQPLPVSCWYVTCKACLYDNSGCKLRDWFFKNNTK